MDPQTQEQWARIGAKAWMGALIAGLLAWWAAMVAVPASRLWFVPASMGDGALWAFALGDAGLILAPTLYALRQHDRNLEQARASSWVVTGALAYSAAWSVGATLWSWEAPMGPPLMLFGAGVQASVTWTMQPVEGWFRVSRATSTASRVARTVAHAVLFDGMFLVILPLLIRITEDQLGLVRFSGPAFWPLIALIVALNAGGLAVGAFMSVIGCGTPLPVDTAAELVVSGPYAHLRNPMAAIGILQGILLGIALGSWLTVAYTLAGAVVWQLFVRPVEESDLERRFGESYAQYRAAVPLWLPRLSPYRPA